MLICIWTILILSILKVNSGLLYKLVDGWILEALTLTQALENESELKQWLGKYNLVLHHETIVFTYAYDYELKYLPLAFYERYASREQRLQILEVLDKLDYHEDEYLCQIYRLAKLAEIDTNQPNSMEIFDYRNPWGQRDTEGSSKGPSTSDHSSSHSSTRSNKDGSGEGSGPFVLDF